MKARTATATAPTPLQQMLTWSLVGIPLAMVAIEAMLKLLN